VALPNKTILAFAEARINDCGDNGAKWIVFKKSVDNGMNWGSLQIIGTPDSFDCLGNPTALYDKDMDRLFLQYVDMIRGKTLQVVSNDRGNTWSDAFYIPDEQLGFPSVLPGPGQMLKVKANNNFRYVYCGSYFDLRGAWSTVVYYSDDLGNSFKPSSYEMPFSTFSECQVIELKNGTLFLMLRNNNPNICWCQAYSLSFDKGENWIPPMAMPQMVNPIVFASLIEHQNYYYWSVPNSSIPLQPSARGNVTVFKSYDGFNWSHHQRIYSGPSSYSVVAGIASNLVGVLFENGVVLQNEKISFSLINS